MPILIQIRVQDKWPGVAAEQPPLADLAITRVSTSSIESSKTVFGKFSASEAIQERGKLNKEVFDALRSSPGLVQLTAAQKWNGVLPTTMIPNAGVPMLNLDKK